MLIKRQGPTRASAFWLLIKTIFNDVGMRQSQLLATSTHFPPFVGDNIWISSSQLHRSDGKVALKVQQMRRVFGDESNVPHVAL